MSGLNYHRKKTVYRNVTRLFSDNCDDLFYMRIPYQNFILNIIFDLLHGRFYSYKQEVFTL